MNKTTIPAADFGKKPYAKPEMKAYQMKPSNIICTSSQTEEYNRSYGSDWY